MIILTGGRIRAADTTPGVPGPPHPAIELRAAGLDVPAPVSTSYPLPLYPGAALDFGSLYKNEPSVRTVIDFIARNIAQLGLHVFRRDSDLDRTRLTEGPLPTLLEHPNPLMTRYHLIERVAQDACTYGNAYLEKVRTPNRLQLVPLLAGATRPVRIAVPVTRASGNTLYPLFTETRRALVYETVTEDGQPRTLAPQNVVHFRYGSDPSNPLCGLSPLYTLRSMLAGDRAATQHAQEFFGNAARMSGVIERPKDTKWTPETRSRFQSDWERMWSRGAGIGKTAILEDGMTYKPITYSARDSQLIEQKKLIREELARAYQMPLPMVGILDHATFSNIREQHKQLYSDALGPWLVMLEEEIGRSVVTEFGDTELVYVEFNFAEKLKGSFEEQASAIQVLCGGPIMTRNEGRARLNLPRIADPSFDVPLTLPGATTPEAPPRPADPDARALPPAAAAESEAAA